MIVVTLPERIRLLIVTVALLAIVAAVPARAQKLGPDGAPNPTASVVDQQTLLKQVPRIEGRIDIPDRRAAVLIQPMGRTWAYFHEVLLYWGGAIVILGMIVVLAAAYLIMGRLRITAGRSGQKVLRFNAFERFAHWLTAVSFVVLGLTGLNITFGKMMLLPVIGPDAFSSIAQAGGDLGATAFQPQDARADVSLNPWLALTPPELVQAHLKVDPQTLAAFRKEKSPVVPV